jgi:hypothetical protein
LLLRSRQFDGACLGGGIKDRSRNAVRPQYGSIVLGKEQIKHLKKGKNVLAVYSNDHYDLQSPEHYAAIDVRIEGCTKADQENLDLALEEVLSPKDRKTGRPSTALPMPVTTILAVRRSLHRWARRLRGPSCLFRNE